MGMKDESLKSYIGVYWESRMLSWIGSWSPSLLRLGWTEATPVLEVLAPRLSLGIFAGGLYTLVCKDF